MIDQFGGFDPSKVSITKCIVNVLLLLSRVVKDFVVEEWFVEIGVDLFFQFLILPLNIDYSLVG